ncbi:hypothetical protein GCM10010156_70370 [Planobispora rosea]|uniref:Uncharacterized protein n=1 Tax=Planobispora rosea TaxID=35762 RepID=A0A8J3S9L4_PLARO|nr:hypothetical protein [Planobispora rosea]GGT02396.1 hypothetical protein GCM10010156_70370 [Planobispora rosea]GIH88551.1 hypothetical protein Pro02_69590 [Planobispora rosea]
MNPRILRTPFVAAPLLVLAYGVIRILDGLDGSRGPGLAWTTGHLAFIAALILFVPIFWQLRRMAGRDTVATVSAVTGLAGGAAFLAQFTIDIVVGFMAADHAAMGPLFDRVQSIPGVSPVVYGVGPALFSIGQLALAVQLAFLGRVRAWVPVLVLAYSLLPLIDKDLIPLSAVCLLVSFVPLARRATVSAPVAPGAVRT